MTVATSTDRRRAPRRQPALGTILRLDQLDADGKKRFGLVWNISTTGLSMLFNEHVRAGDTLRGDLATERGSAKSVVVRIAHVSKLMTGDFVLGCQFDHPMSTDELRPFVADLPSHA
jgi:hypothetical protein